MPFGEALFRGLLGLSFYAKTNTGLGGRILKEGEKSFALPVAEQAKDFSRQRPRFLAVRYKILVGATVDRRITAEPLL